MVTRKQLESIGFSSLDNTEYVSTGSWECMYNVKTQELWFINDGFGEPELLCKQTDFDKLEDLIDYYENRNNYNASSAEIIKWLELNNPKKE